MIKITYAILTFNRKQEVLRAVESVYRQKGLEDYESEIVLADAASVDGTTEAIAEKYPNVKIIKLPYNIGCPSGRNYIYANSTGDFIINIDDDGYLEDNAVKVAIDTFNADEKIGVVEMKQLFIGTENRGGAISNPRKDIGSFKGCVASFRASALKEVGYYPDDYFMYGEEDYLALKFLDKGYRIVFEPNSIMWHPEIGGSQRDKHFEFFKYKNRMLTIIRLYPFGYIWKYLAIRLIAELRTSILRCSFVQYLKALIVVLSVLPKTLMTRNACKKETVNRFLELKKKDQ